MSSLQELARSASEQSVPAPRTWLPRLSLEVKQRVRRIRWSFRFAMQQSSESYLYEGVNDAFKYPMRLYTVKGYRRLHWTPQGAVEFQQRVKHRDLADVNDPDHPSISPPASTASRVQTRSMTREIESAATEDENDEPEEEREEALRDGDENANFVEHDNAEDPFPSAAFSNASSDVFLVHSQRITDFLLALSGFDSKGIARPRGIVAVVEVKKLPPDTKAGEEHRVAGEVVTSALPQLIQQVRYALHQYPNQSEVWGIVVVGGYCQYFKFHRDDFPELNTKNAGLSKFKPPRGKKLSDYGKRQGRVHSMVHLSSDCYTKAFMDHFNEMMKWSEVLMEGLESEE